MPNKRYVRGRRKEYSVMDKLRKEKDWTIVQRSKGSHSPIDIFAINKKKKIIRFIQVKASMLSNSEEQKIRKENDWLSGKFDVEFEVECQRYPYNI